LVESKLIDEWKRRSGKDEVSNSVLKTGNSSNKFGNGKKTGKGCFSCGDTRHFAKNCPKKMKSKDLTSGKGEKVNQVSNDNELLFIFFSRTTGRYCEHFCETNSSSESSIYQSMRIKPTTIRLRIRCLPN
jgi:hypothetical protein